MSQNRMAGGGPRSKSDWGSSFDRVPFSFSSHQVGSAWPVHAAGHRFIPASSSDPPQPSGVLDMRRNPPCIARSLAVCSVVLGYSKSLQFWSSRLALRPFPPRLSSRNDILIRGDADQQVNVTLACWRVAWCHPWGWQMLFSTSDIQICSVWCFGWQGSGLCRTAEVTGHSALEDNCANWLPALFAFIFYVYGHTADSPTTKETKPLMTLLFKCLCWWKFS